MGPGQGGAGVSASVRCSSNKALSVAMAQCMRSVPVAMIRWQVQLIWPWLIIFTFNELCRVGVSGRKEMRRCLSDRLTTFQVWLCRVSSNTIATKHSLTNLASTAQSRRGSFTVQLLVPPLSGTAAKHYDTTGINT